MPQSPLLLGLWVAQPCDYRVEVQTGDVFNAGTNSKIMANVFGELGSTGKIGCLVSAGGGWG